MDAAKDSKYMLQPGEAFPAEGSAAASSSVPSPTSSSITTTIAPATATPTSASTSSHSSGLSDGAIAGIAIGAAAVALLVAALCFFIGRSNMLRREIMQRQSIAPFPNAGNGFGLPPGEPAYQAGSITYLPVKTSELHRQSHISENPVPPYMSMSPVGQTFENNREESLGNEERNSGRGGGMSPTGEQRYV